MGFISVVKSDFRANGTNTKGKLIVLSFRVANFAFQNKGNLFIYIPGLIFIILHKLLVQWLLGVDLPEKVQLGAGLCIYHGQGLVVNELCVFGSNIILRQNTTIGNKIDGGGAPLFGNNINIGANSVIIGEIFIGDNVIIGAGSVITKDIPANSVVVGNPGRVIKQI